MQPRRIRKRTTNKQTTSFINQVIAELQAHPEKLDIVRQNLDEYREQTYLKRGFLLAIERFDWVFEASNDVNFICQQILADDYIGNRLRRYPLLFKGVINST
ncbi:hypothetical protein CWC16_01250 [Pseudoalteromonas sp. S3776]|uniref:Uncharacterized protein n=1 Tax=Pseudoalteromonas undina TaxID=43660 RepID=A0ACC6QZ14_9GAMM|nr:MULTISPECIES: hypothetical protein [unclassified Pseudoalteromonas]KPZ58478.1 hypothetical protein AN393_00286 [Pseudoalteromonas sp. P1-25]KPZ60646.1 hypothetical protein AN391_00258 [Pseudoalteromonas sp. P1-13-1a]TMO71428.1 hypothetical protein CWC17_16790 [Pseudoalteromonas sp. S3785]TMO81785.1 hypothetical protein CWC16_01250 [Pseudoalteromonas sp. S3776]